MLDNVASFTVSTYAFNALKPLLSSFPSQLNGNMDMASLRSSMPMLSADADWTLHVFYLMILITFGVVANLLYSEAQRKKNRGLR